MKGEGVKGEGGEGGGGSRVCLVLLISFQTISEVKCCGDFAKIINTSKFLRDRQIDIDRDRKTDRQSKTETETARQTQRPIDKTSRKIHLNMIISDHKWCSRCC